MPTPFTHLNLAQRLLKDSKISSEHREFLNSFKGAFFLGNVAPDAQALNNPPLKRVDTHFFPYQPKVSPPAVKNMLSIYPQLSVEELKEPDRKAFMAGYVAHLVVDEVWCEDMLFPHFWYSRWGSEEERIFILHVILSLMDIRDYKNLGPEIYVALMMTHPNHWLPFLSDKALDKWRHIVAGQFAPNGGTSQTIAIMGRRVKSGVEGLRAILQSPQRLEKELWQHVPRAALAQVEAKIYQRMLQAVSNYLGD